MIKKLPSGRWQIDYRTANNARVRESFDTRAEATSALKERHGGIEQEKRGLHNTSHRTPVRTLMELLDFHFHSILGGQLESKKDWRTRAMGFITWCEVRGIRYAHQVTKKLAMEYAAHCVATYQGSSIAMRIGAASTIFKSEIDFSEPPSVVRNPFNGIKKSGYTRKRPPKLVVREQLAAFLECCPEFEYHLFRLAYSGGFRPGEVRNLTWAQIKPHGIELYREDWDPKTDESASIIRYNTTLRDSIEWFRQHTGAQTYVVDVETFRKKAGHKNHIAGRAGHHFILDRLHKVRRIAEQKYPEYDWHDFTPHKLRTAFGSHLAELGSPMTHIQKLMRHKNYATTDRWYVNVAPSPLDESAKIIDTALTSSRVHQVSNPDPG